MKGVFQLFKRLPKFKFLSAFVIFTPLTFLSFISCSVESKTSESQPPKSETPKPKLEEAQKTKEAVTLTKLEEAKNTKASEEPLKKPENDKKPKKEAVRYGYSSAYARDWVDKTFPEIEEVVKSFPPHRKLTDEEGEVYDDKRAEYLKKEITFYAEALRRERMKEKEKQ